MSRAVFLVTLTTWIAVAPATASQFAEFENGKVLEVAGAERRGDRVHLTLPGGGAIAFPAASVVNLESLGPAIKTAEPAEQLLIEERVETNLVPADQIDWRLAAGRWADLLAEAAELHGLDPAFLTAVARAESNLDPGAVSPKGACGLLQLMPKTARRFGVRSVFDPRQNVDGGARYLRWLLERYGHDYDLALAGYNAGEGAVDRHRGIPPYPETRGYVRRVIDSWRSFGGSQP